MSFSFIELTRHVYVFKFEKLFPFLLYFIFRLSFKHLTKIETCFTHFYYALLLQYSNKCKQWSSGKSFLAIDG